MEPLNALRRNSRLVTFLLIPGLLITAVGQADVLTAKECQLMSALLVRQQVYMEWFDRRSKSDSPGTSDDMWQQAYDYVNSCGAKGGAGAACAEYGRIMQADGAQTNDLTVQVDMSMSPQTCKITQGGSTVEVQEAELENHPSPATRALLRARYKELARHQRSCVLLNDSGNYRDGGPPSPYALKRSGDKQWFARQSYEAHRAAIAPLRQFLKDQCTRPDIRMIVNDLLAKCGEAGAGEITIEKILGSTPQGQSSAFGPSPVITDLPGSSLETFLIRLADFGRGSITSDETPFQIGDARPVHKCPLKGSCDNCCSETGETNAAFLFGGPNQSLIVGETSLSLSCSSSSDCGSSTGDPHICTHDNLHYDFQGVGEFVLSKSKDLEVQARFTPYGDSKYLSVNSAVAAKLGKDRIGVYAGDGLRLVVNGGEMAAPFEIGESLTTAAGVLIKRYENKIRFSQSGFAVEVVTPDQRRISNVFVRVPDGVQTVGLLGNRNGKTDDDVQSAGGQIYKEPVSFEDLYKKFGASWRVTQDSSLFDYAKGESTATFTDATLPLKPVSVRRISDESRKNAETVCREAGVKEGISLENCILDVAMTGDKSFAGDAAAAPAAGTRLKQAEVAAELVKRTNANGVSIEIPAEVIGSFPMQVRITGPVEPFQIRSVPAGGGPNAPATNAYSDANLKGGDEVLTLHAPYPPGNYELLYVNAGRLNTLLAVPFKVVAPVVDIFAPETAEVGKSVIVRLVGDISPNAKINIVPVGSPDEVVGAHVGGLREGDEQTVEVHYLPKEPGEYEIRYSSWTSHVIYARKKLTIR